MPFIICLQPYSRGNKRGKKGQDDYDDIQDGTIFNHPNFKSMVGEIVKTQLQTLNAAQPEMKQGSKTESSVSLLFGLKKFFKN